LLGGAVAFLPVLLCGLAVAPPAGAVVGGAPAAAGQAPWTVAIGYRGQDPYDGQFCGGTVVASRWVMTAAHCLIGERASQVGILANQLRLDGGGGQQIPVARIIVEPRYNPNADTHDAALLLLASPTTAPPLAITSASQALRNTPGNQVTVAGWGETNQRLQSYPDALQVGAMSIVAGRRCQDTYGGFDPGTMICAGRPRSGKPDSCDGDSGGPLWSGSGGNALLVGIVSFGTGDCGSGSEPGVYTRVSAEVAWVSSQVGPQPTLSLAGRR
jgi:secreted trypsin-like serine protease